MQSKQIVSPDSGLFENISSLFLEHFGHFPILKIIFILLYYAQFIIVQNDTKIKN